MKISIITINFNNASGLKRTVDSVLNQTNLDGVEFIIIDGGSKDGSREFIESVSSRLGYWVSEKDSGIYNAMNKGISKASGEYLLFLNSGDYLDNADVLRKVVAQPLKEDIIYGDIIWDANGERFTHLYSDTVSFEFFTRQSLPHQGTFIRRSLFDSIGFYDEDQKIISDWIFFLLAIFKHSCSYRHIPVIISVCGRDGISCDPANWQFIQSGREDVLKKHFPAFLPEFKEFAAAKVELEQIKQSFAYRVQAKLNRIFRGTN